VCGCGACRGLAAVGEHHRQVDRDPPWIVTGAARTQPSQNVAEGMRKAIALGEIGKQPRACVTDHPAPVRRDDEPGT
jgi:hypothetical protein